MSTPPSSEAKSHAGWQLAPWCLTAAVSLLAIYVWSQSLAWHFSSLSIYQIFPVLGLLAWSIMWSQYMASFWQDHTVPRVKLGNYFRYTGYAVLLLIVLHPGLLIYQRFHDGFGLPPHSYETYVAPSMAWITLLGTVSLLIFLAFELRRWFGDRRWWPYVANAGDLAMLAIFYHGLRLGTQLHVAWFRYVWWLYGLCLVVVLAFKYTAKLRRTSSVHPR